MLSRVTMAVLVAILLAGFAAAGNYHGVDASVLGSKALVRGEPSRYNADWFMRRANSNREQLHCEPDCKGHSSDTGGCIGLHTTKCSGDRHEDGALLHEEKVFTCIGKYDFGEEVKDGVLKVSAACEGLFLAHTLTGIEEGEGMLDNRRRKGCKKGKCDGGHDHDFDAVVKTKFSCGTQQTWEMTSPLKEGSVVTEHTICDGTSLTSVFYFSDEHVATRGDLHEAFEAEVLADIAGASSKSPDKIFDLLYSGSNHALAPMNDEEGVPDAFCNGKKVSMVEPCEGTMKVVIEDPGETLICEGQYSVKDGGYLCEGDMSNSELEIDPSGTTHTESSCSGAFGASPFHEVDEGIAEGFVSGCIGYGAEKITTTPSDKKSSAPMA